MISRHDHELMVAFPSVKGRHKDGLPLDILLVSPESTVLLANVKQLRLEKEELAGRILFCICAWAGHVPVDGELDGLYLGKEIRDPVGTVTSRDQLSDGLEKSVGM